MVKTLTKTVFGVPSADIVAAIDDSDSCAELQAATYRFQARMADLERQFEAQASVWRKLYLEECAQFSAP